MGDDDLLVTISGPALSLLFYENARIGRIGDQLGFLLGEVLLYVTKKVTDSERDIEQIKHHIHIKSVVSYPISQPFFDSVGQIDKKLLDNFLKENSKNVVGWYHYSKECRLVPTFRDKCLHKSMSKHFSNINELLTENNFIMCVLNSTVNETGGTHKFKYMLMRKHNRVNFKPVPLKINNLGVDATRPDGSDYKPTPKCSSSKSDAFDVIYDKIKKEGHKATGLPKVKKIQQTAEQYLDDIIPLVHESDKELSKLEIELFHLRNDFFREQVEKVTLTREVEKMEIDSSPNRKPEGQLKLINLSAYMKNGQRSKIIQTVILDPNADDLTESKDEKSHDNSFSPKSPIQGTTASPKSIHSDDTLHVPSPAPPDDVAEENLSQEKNSILRPRTDEFLASSVHPQSPNRTNRNVKSSPEYPYETID